MNQIKSFLKVKRNLVILATLLITLIIVTVFYLQSSKTVTLNKNIVFEYQNGFVEHNVLRKTIVDSSNKDFESIELLDAEKLINARKAFSISESALQDMKNKNMSEASIQEVLKQYANKETFVAWAYTFEGWADYNYFNTTEVSIKAYGKTKRYPLDYIVLDTQLPILEGLRDLSTAFNTVPDFKREFKAYDPVDGELEIIIGGDITYETPSTYSLFAYALDANGNRSEKAFRLTVLDAIVKDPDTDPSEEPLVAFKDSIIVNVEGPLGVGRVIDLEASGLKPENVSIAYKTQSKGVTLFMTEEVFSIDDLNFSSENACIEMGNDAFYRFPDKHLSYECKPLSNGTYGINLIDGAGFSFAYLKDPVTDTIVINIDGVKTEHVITYHRRFVGSYLDMINETEN